MVKWIFLFIVLLVLVCLVTCPNNRDSTGRAPRGPAAVQGPGQPATGRSAKSDGSSSTPWFQGGNLHKATIAEWKNASYQNKLATAADWLAATKWKGHLKSTDDFERIKSKAQMLANAVDESTAGLPADHLKAADIAATLLSMSNDLGP